MKILYIVDNYYPHIGGAELLFQLLAEGMASENHTVMVLTPKNFPDYLDEEVYNGVHIIRQPVPPFAQRYFFTFLAIFKAISLARQHDIIHTATFNSIPLAWLAGKLTRRKTVLTVYEVWDKKWHQLSGQSRPKAMLLRLIERVLLLFRFDEVICISNSTLSDYQQLVPKASSQRIYPGVAYADMEAFRLSADERLAFRRTKGWLDSEYVLVGFGRPGISKGFDYLVDAVPEVVRSLSNARFKFIWPSAPNFISLRSTLVQRLDSFNLGQSIEVLDKQSRADLFAYIQSADCVVIPSLAEGFGYAAIEACLLAKSVVATTAGSIPEVVSGNVLLVKPADSSALATGLIAMYKRMSVSMPVRYFTTEDMIEAHDRLYHELLGQSVETVKSISQ